MPCISNELRSKITFLKHGSVFNSFAECLKGFWRKKLRILEIVGVGVVGVGLDGSGW